MQGTIIKGISGFYYVKSDSSVIECKARGKFRHNELTPVIGDNVDIELDSNSNQKGVITNIYPRKNILTRPVVSNVTQAFIVFALKNPDINIELLNKFLIQCEFYNIDVSICINKMDLGEVDEYKGTIDMIQSTGYEMVYMKAKEGMGIERLKEKLKGNLTVICGPSGAGKSTILNKLSGKDIMETGDISVKLKRGKHTTRHSELVEVGDGLLVDTPGFSSFDLDFISKEELQYCLPEFEDYIGKCKYSGCQHHKEPYCAVKEAVENGYIDNQRYEFYIKMLQEITSRRNKR